MIGWWPGDGDATDIIAGNNGVLAGNATFGIGEVMQAFSFPGAGSVDIPYSAVATPAGITVDAWVNPTSIVGGAAIFDWRSDANNTGIVLKLDSSGQGQVDWKVFAGASGASIETSVTLPLATWTHVAATFDGNTAQIYFNGSSVAVANITQGQTIVLSPLTDIAADAQIGSNIVNDNAFDGLIDEVEVFNRAISAAEINALVTAGPAGKCKDVLFRSNFGDTFTLTVANGGTSAGTVTSTPAGIDCGSMCTADFPRDSVVTVISTPDAGTGLSHWTGACTGTGICSVLMSKARSVSAFFISAHSNCIDAAGGAGVCAGWTLGQPFYDYNPLGTYNETQATEAALAWNNNPVGTASATCGPGVTENVVINQTSKTCAVWGFAGSAYEGHVLFTPSNSCVCPTNTDPTWN